MSTYYLINRTKVGTRVFHPGALIDDAVDDIAAIAAGGGLLVTSSDATIAAAAAIAASHLSRSDHLSAAFAMMAAATKSSAGDDIAVDLASTAASKGAALVGIADATTRFAGTTAEAAFQDLGGRINLAVADATALQAVSATVRTNGMVCVKLDDDTVWTFDSASSASASNWVIVPSAGTGRWLRSHMTLADLTTLVVPSMQAVNATLSSGTIAITTGIVVATASEVIPYGIGNITGSTNFAGLRERKSARVNGGSGVGAVTIDAVGADGLIDADAAGAIRVLILTPN